MAAFNSSVWDAAKTGNLHDLVSALASHPHLIDTPHPHRQQKTPMYIASEKGHVEIMAKLVELGSAVIDTPDNYGWTLMYVAAHHGRVSVIETLVRLGSKAIDTPNKYGMTPMYIATLNGHVSVIETLVRLGSTAIDTPDNFGRIPLYSAAYYSDADSVKTLKILGAKWLIVQEDSISDDMLALLNTQVDEDEAAELRYQVYFSRSLMERLLFELEMRCNQNTKESANPV